MHYINNTKKNQMKKTNSIFKADNISWNELQPYAYGIASHLLNEKVDCEEEEITCPGEHLHSNESAERHCLLYMGDGKPPTIYCVHESCKDVVDDCNLQLRKRIGYMKAALSVFKEQGNCGQYRRMVAASQGDRYIPNSEIKASEYRKQKMKLAEKERKINVKLKPLLEEKDLPVGQNIENLPSEIQTLTHLSIFKNCQGNIWVGERYSSGEKFKANFGKYKEVTKLYAKGLFTNTSTFSGCSRTNKDVVESPYIVFESDEFKEQFPDDKEKCIDEGYKLIKRICHTYGLTPTLILDSGNSSVHAWFLRKEIEKVFDICTKTRVKEAGNIFEALKMDRAMVKLSQPARLAGKWRKDRLQKLMYFNTEKIYK